MKTIRALVQIRYPRRVVPLAADKPIPRYWLSGREINLRVGGKRKRFHIEVMPTAEHPVLTVAPWYAMEG